MEQQRLIHEDIYEAGKDVVKALGGSKTVASRFWPEKPLDKSVPLLNNCLDRNRLEKLDPEQWMLLEKWGREINCHILMNFRCQETGYKCEPVNPEDEIAKLQRAYIDAVEMQKQIVDRMEKLHK